MTAELTLTNLRRTIRYIIAKGNSQKMANGSTLDFEAQLWAAADKIRRHMDASEYKHVCLGLIFLKNISDAYEEKREQVLFGFSDPNLHESRTLAALRDALLPTLLSGELRVPAASGSMKASA